MSYGINLEDLRTALTETSVNAAKGNFDGPRQDFQIDANDQLITSKDYRNVVVAYRNGAPVMLTNIARVVDGVENSQQAAWMDETPAVILNPSFSTQSQNALFFWLNRPRGRFSKGRDVPEWL